MVVVREENRLGAYLRARRELVTPESVGLPVHGVRRVPGLRREEVAMLAGISAEYYLRLEQGRDRNPSPQVLDALARVLRLDDTATAYLHELAASRPRARRRRPRRPVVPPQTAQLLEVIGVPAIAVDTHLDVLAANALATALDPAMRVGENRMRSLFLDPAQHALYPDWVHCAPHLVATYRNKLGPDVDDPRAVQLVGELSLASEEFRRSWARHDVRQPQSKSVRVVHPQVGEMRLWMAKLQVDGTDGIEIIAHHAEPGTADADRLALLGSLVADPARSRTAVESGRH
ncbi:Helix-turn-helix domain-containing protein [Pseudonocardia thermophila]|uniref:Helix-turn-helix domain-containing protein n=1 Tax=Pseudonocardia thermophila TaxID=1848 RepID=A0A1M6SGE4_PSETH|nr:Helix-turn-helix domain-containing protein [Pseudonocardia thermophila]